MVSLPALKLPAGSTRIRKVEHLGQADCQALGHPLEPEVVGMGAVHQAVAPRRSQQVRALDDFDVAVAGAGTASLRPSSGKRPGLRSRSTMRGSGKYGTVPRVNPRSAIKEVSLWPLPWSGVNSFWGPLPWPSPILPLSTASSIRTFTSGSITHTIRGQKIPKRLM